MASPVRRVGRYLLLDEIATGGMATVFMGRLAGPSGFSRMVAIKRLHTQFARDPSFVAAFLDEGRLAAYIRHGNVVSIVDVVSDGGELFLVMDYIHGLSLSKLVDAGAFPTHEIACAIVAGVLHGLHAAHEATTESGAPLKIVHRDVSPQNILVGVDGIARVLDFGIAKAASRMVTTQEGTIKGKLRYMAPEQLRGEPVDRRVDIFSAAVVLWELLAKRRLFDGADPHVYVARMMGGEIDPLGPDVPPALAELVMRGLAPRPQDRFSTAREMAVALEAAVPPVAPRAIGDWVERVGGAALVTLRERIDSIESSPNVEMHAGSISRELDERAMAASARAHRAALPTFPEQDSVDEPQPQAQPASASPRRAMPRNALLLVLIAFVTAGVALARRDDATGGNATATSVAPVVSSAPRDVASARPNGEASPSEVLLPVPSTSASIAPSARPLAASSVQRPPSTKGRPRPSTAPPRASQNKSALCMKQRADGVVYFEPCAE